MEGWQQRRTALRSAFTKVAKSLDEAVSSDIPNADTLAGLIVQLGEKSRKIAELDKCIVAHLQREGCTQEQFDREFQSSEDIRDQFILCETKAKRLLARLDGDKKANEPSGRNSRKKYTLPEIELKKFGGDLKDWLGFWGQFKKIHDDKEIDPEDKYQYLIQATIEGSKAREVVESFPPTADSYVKAVEYLKSRFGKDDTLVEVYVRELLRLVLSNTLNPKNAVPLSELYDKLETQLRALETLGVTQDKYAAMLYPLVEASLPEDVLRASERHRGATAANTEEGVPNQPGSNRLASLMQFLRNEVEGEERIRLSRTGFGLNKESRSKQTKHTRQEEQNSTPTAAELFNSSQGSSKDTSGNECVFCEKSHLSQDCRQANKMTLQQKRDILNQKRCCFICLRKGHVARLCKSKHKVSCQVCQRRHFTLMCPTLPAHQQTGTSTTDDSKSPTNATLANQTHSKQVLLQTLKVRLHGKCQEKIVRALIDSGSQRSYILQKSAIVMGYECTGKEKLTHGLFGGVETEERQHLRYQVHLSNINGDYRCNFDALDQPRICSTIPAIPDGAWMKELQTHGITLSDKSFLGDVNDEIQVLIGADILGKLLTGKILQLESGPVATETRLGWTLMGKLPARNRSTDSSLLVFSLLSGSASIADLWRLDSIGITDPAETKTREEMQETALEYFAETVEFDSEGRYIVPLPWIDGHPALPCNRQLAEKRLETTVKNLKASGMLESYQEILDDWHQQGIIERVQPQKRDEGHYLPHRAVIREDHATTKVRPVFDASAHEKNMPSLNACLEKGLNLLEVIPSILTRFRLRKLGVVADIKQAFLQIWIRESDRNYLRFLWHEKGQPQDKVVYRHCRVVFGVSSSPFLLGATLAHHLKNAPPELEETAARLRDSFYVDNCVASVDSEEDLKRFIYESQALMSLAKFDLRGWTFTSAIPHKTRCDLEEPQGQEKTSLAPVLGLSWDTVNDTLSCDLRGIENNAQQIVTKRKILSVANKIFDPIGFTCPVTLCPKLLLQKAWDLKLSWDQELPPDLVQKFRQWMEQIPLLRDVRIPRWMLGAYCNQEDISLHVFCDASQSAYATVVYVRAHEAEAVVVQLAQAKTRVAPRKSVTIPRLELLACCIGARLADSVKKSIHRPDICTYFWTDSMNALHWIKNEEQWATFVWNRVKEIRTLSDVDSWSYVPGPDNPADLPSRGCSAQQLHQSKWWEGPEWLKGDGDQWPKMDIEPDREVVCSEKKKTAISALRHKHVSNWYCKYFSSYPKTVRMLAWIYRFCDNSKLRPTDRRYGELTSQEFERAEIVLLRIVQKECFSGPDDESLSFLSPVLDENSLLRVKTRLELLEDTRDFRFPIVLPSKHLIVTLLIQWKHHELCHAGVQTVLGVIRERYWILRGRHTVRQVIRRCGQCLRHSSTSAATVPAPLPVDRIRDAAVFEITGVDLAGPLILKGGSKAWVVLYTCAVVRAVHLELVTSLSTEAFLQSLRRFIARRGRPSVVYSDNGTNFIGAANILKDVDWNTVCSYASVQRITWRFNPPNAPWWGGWWERLIGMLKQLLRRVLGRASLNYEDLVTVLCECENVMNSRPLTTLSEDSRDLQPLTPAMFIQDLKPLGIPEVDMYDGESLNRRYRFRQKVREDLRRRFRQEYLGQLQQPTRSRLSQHQLKVGDLVLVGKDNIKRLDWPLARILELYPGKDNRIRVARVQTTNGELVRPVQRLFPLEICTKEENELIGNGMQKQTPKPEDQISIQETTPEQEIVTRSGRRVKPPARLTYSQ